MLEIFLITASQMFVLFFFMTLGYIFKKKNVTPDSTPTVLSKLEMYIILPALCFSTFAEKFTRDVVSRQTKTLLWATLVLVVSGVVALLLARLFSKEKNTVMVYTYALTIPNIAYIGYPLITAVFGDEVMFDFMVFALPFQVYIYSIAIYMLNPRHEFSLKSLLNPSLIALFLGAAVGICGIKIPAVIDNILSMASSCMAPIAMLLSGFILARSSAKELLSNPKMYLASFLRLIVLPAVFAVMLILFGADKYNVMLCACMLSLPMGLNNIVFPEAFGGDSKTGAQSCFVCNILGLFTVPVMFALITKFLA